MLRDYQQKAITEATAALFNNGSAVLQMPTGSGKTKTATEIIREAVGVVWFICHRQEIERQAAAAFAAAGIEFGIVSPRAKPDYSKRVQIISVAAKCLADMPQPDLVIWDECHHVPAKSWAALHASLSEARHLGLTATPERLDGKGLKDWFSELIVGPSISELIDQGHLSPFRYFAPSEPDLTAAKLQAGDYKRKDADAAMNTPVLIGDAVAEYRRSADGKRAIAFCTSVEASKALVERFNAEGIPAAHVDGDTDGEERKAAIAAFEDGAVKVLSNVEVFTEGFDVPGIEAVILMRPTKSVTLLLQMIGRALRYVEGKTAVIMDHAGLHRDHGWFASDWNWSIDGGAARARRMGGGGVRRCPECKEVRGERFAVCECGYEFPTGRDVGEFDGVLHEVRGDVPEGYERQVDFARRIGRDKGFVSANIRRGRLPSEGGYVKISDALKWYEDYAEKPAEVETTAEFSRRCGVYISTPKKWIERGIPTDAKGRIIVAPALEWLSLQDSLVSASTFAEMHCVDCRVVSRWVSLGMPSHPDGRIPRGEADEWVARELVGRDVSEKVVQFARRIGARESFSNTLARSGVPRNIEGMVVIDAALAWFEQSFIPRMGATAIPMRFMPYEDKAKFAYRVGVSQTYFYGKENAGLPVHHENGWVHIQRGLEWVRDNTNIEIPPSAWPSANDNRPDDQSEAA